MKKQVLKEPNSVQMIDAHAAKLSDYSYPNTNSSNWTAVPVGCDEGSCQGPAVLSFFKEDSPRKEMENH